MLIAFYVAPEKFLKAPFTKIIRWWTQSRVSHVELVFENGDWFSSSERDGGVRFKAIDLDPRKWEAWELPVGNREQLLRQWCERQAGKKYDWRGIGSFAWRPKGDDPDRWFCSEICLAALQATMGWWTGVRPASVAPGDLAAVQAFPQARRWKAQ